MGERTPLSSTLFALGWLAGIVWAAVSMESDSVTFWLIGVGVVAVVWLAVWSVIYAVGALFVGAVLAVFRR